MLRPLLVYSDKPDLNFPDTPFTKGTKYNYATLELIFTLVGPPNLSMDKAKILEKAIEKSIKDPAYLKWAKKVSPRRATHRAASGRCAP